MIKLITPKNNYILDLLRKEHIDYINNPHSLSDSELDWDDIKKRELDLSTPVPILFKFEPAIDADVYLTDSHGRVTVSRAVRGCVEIYNLLIGERYTWHVKAGMMTSESSVFYTASQPPRLLSIDGISNVRDIGGFQAADGRAIKQGLVYRSTECDKNYNLTASGKATLLEQLGIRTELDVRGINGESVSPFFLSSEVRRYHIPLRAYGEIFQEDQMLAYKEIFELLAVPSLYPLIIHCQSGMDRTGTLIFILGALLGADEGDLMLDYEMSSFSTWGQRSRASADFDCFLQKFHSYGASAKLAAEGFLHACGVSDSCISTIREILTEA